MFWLKLVMTAIDWHPKSKRLLVNTFLRNKKFKKKKKKLGALYKKKKNKFFKKIKVQFFIIFHNYIYIFSIYAMLSYHLNRIEYFQEFSKNSKKKKKKDDQFSWNYSISLLDFTPLFDISE